MGLPFRVQQGRSWLGLFDDENVSVTNWPESTKALGVARAAMMPITIPTRKSAITRTDPSASRGLQKVRSRCHNPNPGRTFRSEMEMAWTQSPPLFSGRCNEGLELRVVVAGRRCVVRGCTQRRRPTLSERRDPMDGLGERRSLLHEHGRIEKCHPEAPVDALQGRSDLLYLALDQRMLMRGIEAQLEQLKGRMPASQVAPAEIDAVLATHRSALERLRVIEAAMNEETRYKLWQLVAADSEYRSVAPLG